MIYAQPLFAGLALIVGGLRVASIEDPRRARSFAFAVIVATTLALACAALAIRWLGVGDVEWAHLTLRPDAQGWRASSPFVDLLVALLAVGLAPVATHGPRTLATILHVIALALGILAVDGSIALALLWTAQIALVALELRRIAGAGGAPLHKPLLRFQGVSTLALIGGLYALHRGWSEAGVTALLLAIAIREAVVPAHGWLTTLIEHAPLGLVVALIAPQTGVYVQVALLREHTGGELAHVFAAAGALTGVVGAALGVVQSQARRAAAWLVISQTGLIAFGLENRSVSGWTGAMLGWQVLAISTSGFLMTLAALEARRGALSLKQPGGSFARTPRMAVAFLLLGFSSVALPLTLGFVAEDLLMQGSIDEFPHVGFAVILSTALNGYNVMRCFSVLFSGTRRHGGEKDLTRLEVVALTAALSVLFVGGLFPRAFLPNAHPADASPPTHASQHPSNP